MYSYGSGAVGEFLSGKLQNGFKKHLQTASHQAMFDNRECISVAAYEKVFEEALPTDGSEKQLNVNEDPAKICLAGVKDHIRSYAVK